MRRLLAYGSLAALLSGCVVPVVAPIPLPSKGYVGTPHSDGALSVRRDKKPFTGSDGAEAKRAANTICGGEVNSGPRDHFENGAWVFPGGCKK